jgi:hypothetical protein
MPTGAKKHDDPTRRGFLRLVAVWKTETRFLSNINEKCAHPAYQQIIGMGPEVIPFIFEELRRDPDDWFAALRALTGGNPVPPESRGKLKEMASAWLEWGERHGYSPVRGISLSASQPDHGVQQEPVDPGV